MKPMRRKNFDQVLNYKTRKEKLNLQNYLEAKKDAMSVLTEILMIGDPEWMAKKADFARILEYYLYESAREGLAMHLMRETPCVAIDLNKLLALFQYALGK